LGLEEEPADDVAGTPDVCDPRYGYRPEAEGCFQVGERINRSCAKDRGRRRWSSVFIHVPALPSRLVL
jgi:hypothetical protein